MAASISRSTLQKFTSFGELLRFLRRRAGITQLELSIAVGYSDAQISRLEQNLRIPDVATLQARFVEPLCLEDEPEALARLVELAGKLRREDVPDSGECPYKGLSFFDVVDANLFVGREELSRELVDRILLSTGREDHRNDRFFAIVGASGSGKSSLVRAGVVPALGTNPDSCNWPIHILTPGAHPLESMAAVLVGDEPTPISIARVSDELIRDRRSLSLHIRRGLKKTPALFHILLIDQFEELFSLCRYEDERKAFIDNLMTAASQEDHGAIVIITLRADFYACCSDYPELRDGLSRSQVFIGAMSTDELRRVIEVPAAQGDWVLEQGLVDLILHEVGQEPGALPLLSHALFETWQRRQGRTLTLNGYNASGGVRGAIAKTAEAVLTDKFSQEQQSIARRIFLRLTELGDENTTGDTRRKAAIDELIIKPEDAAQTQVVLQALADARLVVTGENSVQVAHEALIREWPRLRDWLEENRAGLRLHRNLTDAAGEWLGSSKDAGILYRGGRLAQVREWAASHVEDLNPLEQEFLQASVSLSEKEAEERELQHQRELEAAQKLAETERQRAEEQNRAASRLRQRAIYLSLSLGAAFILILVASFLAWRADQQTALATSRGLASAAMNNLEIDPERSILLALQAVEVKDLPEAENALHQAVLGSRLRDTLAGGEETIYGVAFDRSRNGSNRFATANQDGTINVYELDDAFLKIVEEPIQTLSNPIDFNAARDTSGHTISFSPDGDRLVSIAENNTAKIWDVSSGNLLQTLTGHTGHLTSASFSPDGQLIATTSKDGTIKIWNAASGQELQTLESSFMYMQAVFSPDGKRLAAGSDKGTLTLWDRVQSPAEPPQPNPFALNVYMYPNIGSITAIAFSPDTRQIAVGSSAINVYDFSSIASPVLFLRFSAHENTINGLHYTPDSRYIISGSLDGGAKVWDSETGQEIESLSGNAGPIASLDLNRDGTRLLIAYLSTNSVKLWDLSDSGNQEWFRISGFIGNNVRYYPRQEQFLVTEDLYADPPQINIFDVSTSPVSIRTSIDLHTDHPGINYDVDESLSMVAMVYEYEFVVHLWDAASGKELRSFSLEETASQIGLDTKGFIALKFSTDGTLLATGSSDGTLIVWEVATGKPLRAFVGHTGSFESIDPLDFSADGTLLASANYDGTVRIWDVETGTLLHQLPGQSIIYPSVSFSPDGKWLLATAEGRSANLWDVKTGKLIRTFQGAPTLIYNLEISPDNRYAGAAYFDGNVYIWDAATGEELLRLPGFFMRFSTDSQQVITLYRGAIYGFFLNIDDLISLANTRLTRTWTLEECQQFLHTDTCPPAP